MDQMRLKHWKYQYLLKLVFFFFSKTENSFSYLLFSIIEIFIEIEILFSRHKRYISFLDLLMHLSIILLFGSSGLKYNVILLPWNLVLVTLVLVLFHKGEQLNFTLAFFRNRLNIIIESAGISRRKSIQDTAGSL